MALLHRARPHAIHLPIRARFHKKRMGEVVDKGNVSPRASLQVFSSPPAFLVVLFKIDLFLTAYDDLSALYSQCRAGAVQLARLCMLETAVELFGGGLFVLCDTDEGLLASCSGTLSDVSLIGIAAFAAHDEGFVKTR